jgi:hypothetical protein
MPKPLFLFFNTQTMGPRFNVQFLFAKCKVVKRYIVENQVVEHTYCQTYKWHFVELISCRYRLYSVNAINCRTDILLNRQVVEQTSCRTDKLSNRQVVEQTSCQTDILLNRQVVEQTYCWTDKLSNRQVVKQTSCRTDILLMLQMSNFIFSARSVSFQYLSSR